MNAKPISPALLQGGMVKCNYILWFLSDKLKKGNKLQNLTIFRDVTYKEILIDSLIWQSQRVSKECHFFVGPGRVSKMVQMKKGEILSIWRLPTAQLQTEAN